jgi:hypothetical protein
VDISVGQVLVIPNVVVIVALDVSSFLFGLFDLPSGRPNHEPLSLLILEDLEELILWLFSCFSTFLPGLSRQLYFLAFILRFGFFLFSIRLLRGCTHTLSEVLRIQGLEIFFLESRDLSLPLLVFCTSFLIQLFLLEFLLA